MTDSEILDDLDYIKSLAEEGRNAPLMSGRIGLWWGILLSITLLTHWASLKEIIPLPIEMIGLVWMSFGIIGGIGSAILSRSIAGMPGIASVNNRLANALWTGNAILMFTYSLSALASALTGKTGFIIMDTITPVAFGLYALTPFVLARISNDNWQMIPGIIALLFVPVSLLLIGTPDLYLAAVIGIILTIIIPSLIKLRREPKVIV